MKKRVHAATHASAKHNVLEVVRNTVQVLLMMEVRACRLPVQSCYHYRGRMMNATRRGVCCKAGHSLIVPRTLRSFGRFERCERCPREPPSVIHMSQSHLWEALLGGTVGQRRGTKRHGEIPEVMFWGFGMLSSDAFPGHTHQNHKGTYGRYLWRSCLKCHENMKDTIDSCRYNRIRERVIFAICMGTM